MIRRYDVGVAVGMLEVMGSVLLLRYVGGWIVILCIVALYLALYFIGFLIQKDMPDMSDCHYYIRQDKEVRLCTNQATVGGEYREISWLEYFWYGLQFYAEGLFGKEEE